MTDRPVDPLAVDPDAEASSRPLHLQPAALALVALGGVIGTYARYTIETGLPHAPGTWPWATFLINLSGAFVLGLLLEGLTRLGPDDGWRRRARLCLGTGMCGAFTTYSTFALEGSELIRDGHAGVGLAYFVTSVLAGVICAWLGIVVASVRRSGSGAVAE